MHAPTLYEPYATAFMHGRALQNGAPPIADAPSPSLYYFKRVPLLPRIQWALGVLHSLQPANLLDIGSGRGKFLWPLLDAFPSLEVTAVDTDPRRVRDLEAVHLGGIERLTVRQADAVGLPFAGRAFDVVTLLEVLEHMPAPAFAISEAVRVARRCLLISAPSKPDDNPEHIHIFTEGDLRAMLAAAGVTEVKMQQAPGHWLVLANVAKVNAMLLSRDEFRQQVFARDGKRCLICGAPGEDAHHIVERRLFEDGGYYLDNCATLCGACHVKAEMTVLMCEEVRRAAGITQVVLPHLYPDQEYDKWSNPILPNRQRLHGELFDDGSVQKILAAGGVLGQFTNRVRYPRTYHLPWSQGATADDRMLPDVRCFEGQKVVVTAKMDGEQTTMYKDYLHARSNDWSRHPSRSWVANLHAQIGWKIPQGWRVCGENLFARHSIHYQHLPAYFLVFSVWNEQNVCLAWEETVEWAALLHLPMVPVFSAGLWNEGHIRSLYQPAWQGDELEGYVVRLAGAFTYGQFRRSVAKFVRAGHDQTRPHWWQGQAVIKNGLADQG